MTSEGPQQRLVFRVLRGGVPYIDGGTLEVRQLAADDRIWHGAGESETHWHAGEL